MITTLLSISSRPEVAAKSFYISHIHGFYIVPFYPLTDCYFFLYFFILLTPLFIGSLSHVAAKSFHISHSHAQSHTAARPSHASLRLFLPPCSASPRLLMFASPSPPHLGSLTVKRRYVTLFSRLCFPLVSLA